MTSRAAFVLSFSLSHARTTPTTSPHSPRPVVSSYSLHTDTACNRVSRYPILQSEHIGWGPLATWNKQDSRFGILEIDDTWLYNIVLKWGKPRFYFTYSYHGIEIQYSHKSLKRVDEKLVFQISNIMNLH